VTVTGVGDGEGEGEGAAVGGMVGAGTGAVVGAGAALGMGAVDAGVDGAVEGPATEEEVPAAAAGWATAGRGGMEPAELCVGTEPEPGVVVPGGRAAGIAAGIPAGVWTARGRYA
jgi:hypothetical protein